MTELMTAMRESQYQTMPLPGFSGRTQLVRIPSDQVETIAAISQILHKYSHADGAFDNRMLFEIAELLGVQDL